MGGRWGQLARVAVPALTGALEGDAARKERDRQRARQDTQDLILAHARQVQEAQATDQASRQKAMDALGGILTGTAPTVQAPRMLNTPLGPVADRLPTDDNDPTRYSQVTPDRYIDRTQTPEARAERSFQRQQEGAAAAAARAEKVRVFLAQQQEASAERRANAQNATTLQAAGIRANAAGRGAAGAAGPRTAPIKPVPEGAMKAMIDNQKALSLADEALRKIDATPTAFGVSNLGPGAWVKDHVGASTPAEQATRAAVSDVGSMVIHDRSGAAVTVSEMPRLAPFIPSSSDTPAVARTKLQHLRDGIQQEHELYLANYDEAHGYHSPNLSAPRPGAMGGAAHPVLSKYGITPPGRP